MCEAICSLFYTCIFCVVVAVIAAVLLTIYLDGKDALGGYRTGAKGEGGGAGWKGAWNGGWSGEDMWDDSQGDEGGVEFPDLFDFPEHLSDFFMTEPESECTMDAWKLSTKRGLKVTVLNALTEEWAPFFDKAVEDWDSGTPDALSLSTEYILPDSNCAPIAGAIKVCNGNYGNTDWKGVNEFSLRNGFIIHSVAKMNEYHLSHATDAERQYTMCHEIGHGFGLGHSDTNFFNADLGTCMDYTIRPQDNQHPSQEDYDILYKLYGEVTRRRDLGDKENVPGMGSYRLRKSSLGHTMNVMPEYRSFSDKPSLRGRWNWKLIQRHGELGEVHELDLGDGLKVRAHVLLQKYQPEYDRRKLQPFALQK